MKAALTNRTEMAIADGTPVTLGMFVWFSLHGQRKQGRVTNWGSDDSKANVEIEYEYRYATAAPDQVFSTETQLDDHMHCALATA